MAREEDWADMPGQPPTSPDGAQQSGNGQDKAGDIAALNGFNPADWVNDPEPEERLWIVPGYILDETATLLSGDGGTGKSYLAHQLAVARALSREWIGLLPEPGKTLVVSCEDTLKEMKRRLYGILQFYDACWADLGDNIRLVDLVGQDSILALLKQGIVEAAPMYDALDAYMGNFKPGLTVLDVLAAMFAGNEVVRTQVRQFANLLNRLCQKHKSAVLLLAHPSLTGMNSGTGLSGSTDWNNGFRGRTYLEMVGNKNGAEPETSYRVFKGMKNNYGELGGKINLEWKDGLYIPVHEPSGIEKAMADAKAEKAFMSNLKTRAAQSRTVSDRWGANYAPAVFAKEPEAIAAKITSQQFEAAMERLFKADKIRVEITGPQSRPRRGIVAVEPTIN